MFYIEKKFMSQCSSEEYCKGWNAAVDALKGNNGYNPLEHGAIVAIRIFYAEDGHSPMAEIVFAYESEMYPNKRVVIEWDSIDEKKPYLIGINAYTLWYDERPKREFNEW